MSDTTRDALAVMLDQLLGDPERDTTVREFLARETANTIVERFLVVPRDDLTGTRYACRWIHDGEVRVKSADDQARAVMNAITMRAQQRTAGQPVNAVPVSAPIPPWSVIPLPKDGEIDGR